MRARGRDRGFACKTLVATVVAAALIAAPLGLPAQAADVPAAAAQESTDTAQPSAAVSAANVAETDAADASYGFDADDADAREHVSGQVLVKLADTCSASELDAQLEGAQLVSSALGWTCIEARDAADVDGLVGRLKSAGLVKDVQLNYTYHLADADAETDAAAAAAEDKAADAGDKAAGTDAAAADTDAAAAAADAVAADADEPVVDDPKADAQWALGAVNALGAFEAVKGTLDACSERPSVAVIDTGCNLGHEDLAANIVDCYDAVKRSSQGFKDIDGHGTHVAGIVSAQADNGVGVAGVSYNAGLVPINVFKRRNGLVVADSADILAALEYVIEHAEADRIRVVNMSLGAKYSSRGVNADDVALLEAVGRAYDEADVLTVCAAGNEGASGPYYSFPGDFVKDGISVIGLEEAQDGAGLTRCRFSNYNADGEMHKSLSAPAKLVLSTARGSQSAYAEMTGTSMAAPYVSGVAALVASVNPKLSASQIRSVLYSSARDLGAAGFDAQTGFGIVDACAAVASAGTFVDGSSMLAEGTEAKLSTTLKGAVKWSSSDPDVVEVDRAGVVTGVSAGCAVVSASKGKAHASTIVSVFAPRIESPGKLASGSTATLTVQGVPYGLLWEWSSSDPRVVSVDEHSGRATGLQRGKATLTATLASDAGASTSCVLEAVKTQQVRVDATQLTRAAGAKKSLTLRWAKRAEASGYQLRYSCKKSMAASKLKTVSGASATKLTVKKLKSKKTYYVQVRTFKKSAGTTVYSSWSKAAKVKTK